MPCGKERNHRLGILHWPCVTDYKLVYPPTDSGHLAYTSLGVRQPLLLVLQYIIHRKVIAEIFT